MKNKLYFSCFVDDKPLYKAQAYIWLISLIKQNEINPNDIFVHLTDRLDTEYITWLRSYNINIIKVNEFVEGNPYCNKLTQLNTFQARSDYDFVVLMDCDIAVLSLDGLNLEKDIYAKIVDFPNPPLTILEEIFKANNLRIEHDTTSFSLEDKNQTLVNNANGGLYIISKSIFNEVANKWIKYAKWSLENSNLYTKNFEKHIDQVSFAMALNALGINMTKLGIEWNFPTHISSLLPDIRPRILHFHDQIDQHMHLKFTGLKNVDQCIDEINKNISNNVKNKLNNSVFWDLRYELHPELGSGVGSRGEILEAKKQLIKHLTYGYYDKQIIDVGFGDLEVTKDLPFKKYIGLDVSSKAVELATLKKSNWKFFNKSLDHKDIPYADVVMCFDVLIHQSTREEFINLVDNIIKKANTRVIIAAYNSEPSYASEITHFFEPIEELINKSRKFDHVAKVYEYRDISVIIGSVWQIYHQRDIKQPELAKAFNEVERPDLLQYIVDISRFHFGFYTSHYARVFEYTWVLECVLNTSEINSIIDVGTGVCPVPIALSEEGIKVYTIDGHKEIRNIDNKSFWNEWGFLDYSYINANLESHNLYFEDFILREKVDLIYSISVVEHMPSKNRRLMFRKAASLLRDGGQFLLTIDLVPNTNKLWNLNEGIEVEDEKKHGNVESLKNELKNNGFIINSLDIQRGIRNARTDILYINAVRTRFINNLFKRFV